MMAQKRDSQTDRTPTPPRVGGPHIGPPMMAGKAKLIHPRNVLWRWMLSYLVPFRAKYIFYVVLLLGATVVTAYTPVISSIIIDKGIIGHNFSLLLSLAMVYIGCILFYSISNYISQYGMGKIGQVIIYSMRVDVIDKLQRMSMSYFDRKSSGEIISITTNDVDQLNQLMSSQLLTLISSASTIGVTIIFMFLMSPYLALLSLTAFPIFLIINLAFKRVVTGLFTQTRQTISKVTSTIQENIAGAKVVQAYGQEDKTTQEFDRANMENFKALYKVRRAFSTFFPFTNLVTMLLTVSILLAGGYAMLGNFTFLGTTISIGVLTAFITFLSQFFAPFMMLTQVQNVIESAIAAADRVYDVLQEEADLPDPEDPIPLETVEGSIDFDDVSFGYRLQQPATPGAQASTTEPHISIASKASIPSQVPAFLASIPEPYRRFFFQNMPKAPQNIREAVMTGLRGVAPDAIPARIDSLLAAYGYAVSGSEYAATHPDLQTSFDSSTAATTSPIMPSSNGNVAGSSKPLPNGSPVDVEQVVRLAKMLEKRISQQPVGSSQTTSGGMSGDSGGMMGAAGLDQGNTRQLLRMLASMPIPTDVYETFSENVRNAIEEERKLITHERSVGFVLDHVNLHVDAGKTLAIVGETGAGKTTITKLIARFYDVNSGSVKLDGIDVRVVTKRALRKHIGIVPQDSFLFTGTIRENLLYGINDPTPEIETKMIEVSKFLGLHNFIDALPEKYETLLRENASNISIGQRQLIAFARALIADPKILILDEATSSVDPYTESLIQDALNRARKGRTTIIIAHRLSTIKNADQIIVISKDTKGIIEEGSHKQLKAIPGGVYHHLLEMQRL